MIEAKESLVGTLNTAIEYIQPVTQEKEITPKEEIQEVTPDNGYTGLSKVTVDPIPSEYAKVEGTLDITTNGEYDVKSYEKANVNIGGVTKGVIVNACDENGYISEIEIVGLTEIPDYYLAGQTSSSSRNGLQKLQKVVIPNGVTKIGTNVLTYQPKLIELVLPDSITEIGAFFLNESSSRANLIVNIPANLQKIGMYAFSYVGNTEATFPSGLTEIPEGGLRNMDKVVKLVLEGDITSIGACGFYANKKMTTFVLPNVTSVPTLANSNAFGYQPIASGTGYIYVPDALVEDFKAATNWSTYADQIKGVSELV